MVNGDYNNAFSMMHFERLDRLDR